MIPVHMIHMRLPDRLPSNAKLFRYPFRRPMYKGDPQAREQRNEHIGWMRVGGFAVPYMWFGFDGRTQRWEQSLGCLYWEDPAASLPQKVPVAFSSEHTASSPRLAGEEE